MIPSSGDTTHLPGLNQYTRPIWLQLVQKLRVCRLARQERQRTTQDCRCSKDRQRQLQASLRVSAAASADVETDPNAPSTSGAATAQTPFQTSRPEQAAVTLHATSPAGTMEMETSPAGTMEMELQGRSYRIIQLVSPSARLARLVYGPGSRLTFCVARRRAAST